MQIPFSVPPYMSLLARSTATLEGIALMGDPGYQMVSQVSQPIVQSSPVWKYHRYSAFLPEHLCNCKAPPLWRALMGGQDAGRNIQDNQALYGE